MRIYNLFPKNPFTKIPWGTFRSLLKCITRTTYTSYSKYLPTWNSPLTCLGRQKLLSKYWRLCVGLQSSLRISLSSSFIHKSRYEVLFPAISSYNLQCHGRNQHSQRIPIKFHVYYHDIISSHIYFEIFYISQQQNQDLNETAGDLGDLTKVIFILKTHQKQGRR